MLFAYDCGSRVRSLRPSGMFLLMKYAWKSYLFSISISHFSVLRISMAPGRVQKRSAGAAHAAAAHWRVLTWWSWASRLAAFRERPTMANAWHFWGQRHGVHGCMVAREFWVFFSGEMEWNRLGITKEEPLFRLFHFQWADQETNQAATGRGWIWSTSLMQIGMVIVMRESNLIWHVFFHCYWPFYHATDVLRSVLFCCICHTTGCRCRSCPFHKRFGWKLNSLPRRKGQPRRK